MQRAKAARRWCRDTIAHVRVALRPHNERVEICNVHWNNLSVTVHCYFKRETDRLPFCCGQRCDVLD
jgi:hypothetical protein